MQKISRIFEGLESLSSGLDSVPGMAFLAVAAVCFFLLLAGAFVIPRLKWRERKKRAFRQTCVAGALVIYLLSAMGFMLLTRDPSQGYQIQVFPFAELISEGLSIPLLLTEAGKLLLFVPVGILFVYQLHREERLMRAFLFSFGMSLLVEFLQYIGRMGTFSTGDMILNTLGGFLGAFLAVRWQHTAGRKTVEGVLLRAVFGFSVMVLVFSAAAFGTYHVLRTGGERDMRENVSSVALNMGSRDGDKKAPGESDYIWHNGKAYQYNDQVVTLLCMGIDQAGEEIQKEKEASGESGQADSIFLAVLDSVSSQLRVIAISRDTMTKIPAFDNKGNYLGENVNHLGLAYAYGNGREKSCQYMVDAVSELFYGIPINGYAAFSLETIGKLNDAVGGVTVTVPEGEDMSSADPQLISGAPVTLTGDMAETFVRWRNTEEHGSNNMRIARQKQFLLGFFRQAVAAVRKDVSLPASLYQEFSSEMVTDISLDKAVYLISEAAKMNFNEGNLTVLQGEAKAGKVYDEFYVDDDALYELILDTFYMEETDS